MGKNCLKLNRKRRIKRSRIGMRGRRRWKRKRIKRNNNTYFWVIVTRYTDLLLVYSLTNKNLTSLSSYLLLECRLLPVI
jgi:hypothetical protein